ncbi:MAG: putative signal transducing protein, partial [Polyangia bacterium]
MKMVAVTTVRDGGAAEVAKEALADHGIRVEVRRMGSNVYFSALTAEEFEVRVPEDRVDEAHDVLAALEEDLEAAVIALAGVPPENEEERGNSDLPPPEERPRKISWAIALGLVGPIPGCGVLYARAFKLGWTMVGMSAATFVAALGSGQPALFGILLGLKGLDIFYSPILAAQ